MVFFAACLSMRPREWLVAREETFRRDETPHRVIAHSKVSQFTLIQSYLCMFTTGIRRRIWTASVLTPKTKIRGRAEGRSECRYVPAHRYRNQQALAVGYHTRLRGRFNHINFTYNIVIFQSCSHARRRFSRWVPSQ